MVTSLDFEKNATYRTTTDKQMNIHRSILIVYARLHFHNLNTRLLYIVTKKYRHHNVMSMIHKPQFPGSTAYKLTDDGH